MEKDSFCEGLNRITAKFPLSEVVLKSRLIPNIMNKLPKTVAAPVIQFLPLQTASIVFPNGIRNLNPSIVVSNGLPSRIRYCLFSINTNGLS